MKQPLFHKKLTENSEIGALTSMLKDMQAMERKQTTP